MQGGVNMEEEKRTCVECRYFIQHYTRPKDQKYMAADCGHCSNSRLILITDKNIKNPSSSCNVGNKVTGERANCVAETEDHLIQRSKHLIFEANLPNLFPNLLNRIHFRRIRWDKEEADIIWDYKTF